MLVTTKELRELISICQQNLLHAQELQKQPDNNGVKPWLNSKYIKTKHNQKLLAKFFKVFRIFHLVGMQAYKFQLPIK